MSFVSRYRGMASLSLLLVASSLPVAYSQQTVPPTSPALAPPVIEPAALELLQATATRYGALKSYSDHSEIRVTPPSALSDAVSFRAKLAWEKPNRVRIESFKLAGEHRALAISDGNKLHVIQAKQKGFYVERAATGLSFFDAFHEAASNLAMAELLRNSSPVLASFQREGLKSLRLAPNQQVEGVEMRCIEAQLLSNDNMKIAQTWFIGAEDGLLHRFTQDYSGRFVSDERHSDIQVDPVLPASTWVFTPPEGAKLVEVFPSQRPTSPAIKIGDLVPDFKAPTVDNQQFSLADTDGKAVILQFFRINGPGSNETLELMETQTKFGAQNLSVVAVSMDAVRERVQQFVADKTVTYPVLFDGKGWSNDVATRLGVKSMPIILLIGRDGTLKYSGRTIGELIISKALEAELGEK